MQHAPALFVADAPALDFLNSVATPVDVPVDWLDDGNGLLSWLAQAKLVPEEVLDQMRARNSPADLNKVAEEARQLREWFRGFVREHQGRPITGSQLGQLDRLNRLLRRDESFSEIVLATDADTPFEVRATRRWSSSETLLFPIAETLARFVCAEDFTHVRACEGPICTLLFADHTRSRARRWCSMSMCGNRAKQAAHRQRLKSGR
jgi:predicted RNA-binding Zn ribbon-like protein